VGELVNLNGKRLNPDSPPGLYVSGACPVCGSPIYYHGGGREYVEADAVQPAHWMTYEKVYFNTCVCDFDGPIQMQIPPAYSIINEREALISLFTNIREMLDFIHAMQEKAEHEDSSRGQPGLRLVASDGDSVRPD
jgi:hypothetical protein